jgi:hypothetical protein
MKTDAILSKSKNVRRHFVIISLLIMVVFQLKYVIQYEHPIFQRYLKIEEQGLERSALLGRGSDFRDLVLFLRSNIPEDASILLPPGAWNQWYTHVGFMQYFLYPRTIHNCGKNEIPACIARMNPSNTFYIPRFYGFPPPELLDDSWQYVPQSPDFGLYMPKQ